MELITNLYNHLPAGKLSIGYRLLQLVPADRLADEQEAYRKNFAGIAIANTSKNHWNSSWMVFATDELGAPVFTDVDDHRLPVYTATSEDEGWKVYRVANRIEDYFRFIEMLTKVAEDREDPDMLAKNPIPEIVSEAILNEIEKYTAGCEVWYWELFLENYQIERKFDL